MKKVFWAVLIVFFATALYAGDKVDPLATTSQAARDKVYKVFGTPQVQFDISGEFDARGLYWNNFQDVKDSKATPTHSNSYFQGYLDLFPKLKIGDTQFISKLEITDQRPWAPYSNFNTSDNFDSNSDLYTTSKKANISVERAYIHHNFNEDFFTEVGLMDGQWWGTSFWDNQQPRWRVKFQNKTPIGVIGALMEKDAEVGFQSATKDQEKDDYNAYAVYGVTKVADLTIEPLIFFVYDSSLTAPTGVATPASLTGLGFPAGNIIYTGLDNGNNGMKVQYYTLASRGKVGPLGMEAELGLKNYDTKLEQKIVPTAGGALVALPHSIPGSYVKNDWKEYGGYLNLWLDLDVARVGGMAAYGSYDKKGGALKTGSGLDFWNDFKSDLILGDEIGFGSATAQDLVGMTVIKPYVKSVKLGPDKLTGSASLAYIMSNQDKSKYDGVTAMELDLGVQYKLSDNLMYKVDGGYAQVSVDKKYWGSSDPDAIMLLRHEILLTF
jgi:hypothetical protein